MNKTKEKKETDNFKGTAFASLGKISLLVSQDMFKPFLTHIFDLIDAEIKKPAANIHTDVYYKPLKNTDVLLCIRDLAKTYGSEFERRYSTGQMTTSPPAQREI